MRTLDLSIARSEPSHCPIIDLLISHFNDRGCGVSVRSLKLSLDTTNIKNITNVKRIKSILLSKGEALSSYTWRPGTPWKSMEAHDCKCQWRWWVKTRGWVYDCESVACESIRRSQYRRLPFRSYSNKKSCVFNPKWSKRTWLPYILLYCSKISKVFESDGCPLDENPWLLQKLSLDN